jgi:hypothetical protein
LSPTWSRFRNSPVSVPPISINEDLAHYIIAGWIVRRIVGFVNRIGWVGGYPKTFESLVDCVIKKVEGAKMKILLGMVVYIGRLETFVMKATNEGRLALVRDLGRCPFDSVFIGTLAVAERVRFPFYPESYQHSDYIPRR